MARPRGTFSEVARFCAGVWVVVAVGAVLLLAPIKPSHAVGLLTLAGLSASLIVAGLVTRRALLAARLERDARRLLTADIATAHAPDQGADYGNFESIHAALDELGLRIEDQLKEVAKKSRNLEALIDAMDEPLLATDNDQRILLCNRSAEALLAAGSDRGIVGRPIAELFTQAPLLEMHAAARAGQTRRGRVRVATPLGHRVLQVSALPVPVAWGEGIFGAVMVLRDVTELDHAVQIKSDFVANASHELRTPVAAIRGAAETLHDAANDDPAMAERLRSMILGQAVRLEELLRDLLDLSRLESPDVPLSIESTRADDLERTLRGLFDQSLKERNLEITFEFEDIPPAFRTDRKMLLLVLRNLIENAAKFAHESTTIRVLASTIEEDMRTDGRNGSAATRGVLRFEVIDRGVGIPLAMQERVFERFFQVDSARTGTGAASKRGTGLGLAIVKHAAKALGGRAGLTSVWGEGTTAYVEVPVEFTPAPAPAR